MSDPAIPIAPDIEFGEPPPIIPDNFPPEEESRRPTAAPSERAPVFDSRPLAREPDISVKIFPIKQQREDSNLLAFASITLGGAFAVTGLRVLDSRNGVFVSMPQNKGSNGKYHDICFPTTKELREKISNAVLNEYFQTRGKERPSAREALHQKQSKTAERPTSAPAKKADRGER